MANTPFRRTYTDGSCELKVSFDEEKDGVQWWAQTSGLKNDLTAMFLEGVEGERLDALFRSWLKRVEAFRVKWGSAMVAPDIQFAVNDAQRNLGVAVTDWKAEIAAEEAGPPKAWGSTVVKNGCYPAF